MIVGILSLSAHSESYREKFQKLTQPEKVELISMLYIKYQEILRKTNKGNVDLANTLSMVSSSVTEGMLGNQYALIELPGFELINQTTDMVPPEGNHYIKPSVIYSIDFQNKSISQGYGEPPFNLSKKDIVYISYDKVRNEINLLNGENNRNAIIIGQTVSFEELISKIKTIKKEFSHE